MKVVYLASPFSHMFPEVETSRYHEINKIAANLHVLYPKIAFILPITQSYVLNELEPRLGGAFEQWEQRDLEFIKRSDELWIVTMVGWEHSFGVAAELEYAQTLGIPVKLINYKTLEKYPFRSLKAALKKFSST